MPPQYFLRIKWYQKFSLMDKWLLMNAYPSALFTYLVSLHFFKGHFLYRYCVVHIYYIRKNYWCHLDAPKLVWWQLIDITLLVMIYEKTLLNITFSLLHMNNKCLKTYLKYLTGNCQSKFLKWPLKFWVQNWSII